LLNKTTFYFLKFFAVISLFFSFARSTNQKEEKKVAITQGWNNDGSNLCWSSKGFHGGSCPPPIPPKEASAQH
jgi:preprotein translocase subunit SecG